jgi:hypothetical protein
MAITINETATGRLLGKIDVNLDAMINLQGRSVCGDICQYIIHHAASQKRAIYDVSVLDWTIYLRNPKIRIKTGKIMANTTLASLRFDTSRVY